MQQVMTKTREEVVAFIVKQIREDCQGGRPKGPPNGTWAYHYGQQDLRELLDFLYGGEPLNEAERLNVDTYGKQAKKDQLEGKYG